MKRRCNSCGQSLPVFRLGGQLVSQVGGILDIPVPSVTDIIDCQTSPICDQNGDPYLDIDDIGWPVRIQNATGFVNQSISNWVQLLEAIRLGFPTVGVIEMAPQQNPVQIMWANICGNGTIDKVILEPA